MGLVMQHVDDDGNIKGATHSIVATIMSYYKDMEPGKEPISIRWGRENELKALHMYQHLHQHTNSSMERTGLWVSTVQPYIAASPDSLVSCSCCGSGCVEVKCPWTAREMTISEFAQTGSSFLALQERNYVLKKSHNYYAQVQVQMFCTGRDYCDFVTYTAAKSDNICQIRVEIDSDFVNTMVSKASNFWKKVIFPELVNRKVQMKFK